MEEKGRMARILPGLWALIEICNSCLCPTYSSDCKYKMIIQYVTAVCNMQFLFPFL